MTTATPPHPDRSALTHPQATPRLPWRTRDTTRQLLAGFVASFGIAVATGGLLWLDPAHGNLVQVALIAHLTAGSLAAILFAAFAVVHWRDGREPLRHLVWPFPLIAELQWDPYARQRLIGHATLWALVVVLASGLIIAAPAVTHLAGHSATLPLGSHVPLLAVHRWATLIALALFVLHCPRPKAP